MKQTVTGGSYSVDDSKHSSLVHTRRNRSGSFRHCTMYLASFLLFVTFVSMEL